MTDNDDVLAVVNAVLVTNYSSLDDVPTSKLNRVYMILRITQIMEECGITMPQNGDE